jgi:hypothetical protein
LQQVAVQIGTDDVDSPPRQLDGHATHPATGVEDG